MIALPNVGRRIESARRLERGTASSRRKVPGSLTIRLLSRGSSRDTWAHHRHRSERRPKARDLFSSNCTDKSPGRHEACARHQGGTPASGFANMGRMDRRHPGLPASEYPASGGLPAWPTCTWLESVGDRGLHSEKSGHRRFVPLAGKPSRTCRHRRCAAGRSARAQSDRGTAKPSLSGWCPSS
jgi:hypothetical protein